MNRGFSLYLDGMRFFAAFVVLLSHFAYPRFTGGDYIVIRDYYLGSDAVVLFFVLSGLVISYTADTKDHTLRGYLWSRLTRLYSVALPAVLLTILLDFLGRSANPAAYDGAWFHDAPMVLQLWHGLTFTNEWGLSGFRIGSNGPYWSLSYEFAYYLIFGAWFYLRSAARMAGIALIALISGPAIMIVFPVWLTGALVYRRLDTFGALKSPAAWALALLPPVLYVCLRLSGFPAFLLATTEVGLGTGIVNGVLRFSNEFLWYGLTGLLAALHLGGVAALCRGGGTAEKPDGFTARAICWCAGGSFSLYVVHYPAMQFIDAILPEGMALRHAALLGFTLAVCFLFAALTERRLGWIRSRLKAFASAPGKKAAPEFGGP